MSSTASAGAVIAALLLAIAIADPTAAAPGDVLSSTRTNVNIRMEPSTDAGILRRMKPGETVIEITTKDDWHLVRWLDGGGEGWIYSPLLERVATAPSASDRQVSRPDAAADATTPAAPGLQARRPDAAAGATTPAAPGLQARRPDAAAVATTPAAPGLQARRPDAAAVATTPSAPGLQARRPDAAADATDRLASRLTTFDDGLFGDPTRGETVFYKCGSCHTTVEGIHADGPSLVGVFGRSPARAAGYRYSGAMQAFARSGAVWDEATLDRFIQRPSRVVKGTTMPFSGIRAAQDRRDLIAFLQQLTN